MRRIVAFLSLSLISIFAMVFVVQPISVSAAQSDGANVVVEAVPGPSLGQKLADRATGSWPWYVTRGSGIIAAISLVILLLSGMGMVTGHTFKFLEPIVAWASHRALGIIFAVSVLIHVTVLLFDSFVPFNIMDILVPWLSNYKPVTLFGIEMGSLYVALGVLAFYMTIIITVISILWISKMPRLWKLTHLLSYVVMAFVFIHALYLGTDLSDGILRWAWIGTAVLIALVAIYRLRRAKTL